MKDIFIHSSANIDDSSKIGEGTKIWINVQVRENAEIGKKLHYFKRCLH